VVSGLAAERVDEFGARVAAGQVGGVPLHDDDLLGMREVQVGWDRAVWVVRCSARPWPRSTLRWGGGKRLLAEPADRGDQAGLVAYIAARLLRASLHGVSIRENSRDDVR
jgi:hypothetical protein